MGLTSSNSNINKRIEDRFINLEEVQNALRTAGLESSNLIIGL